MAMAGRTLTEEEGVRWVLEILAGGKRLATREVEEVGRGQGIACPDSTARFLSRMRTQGLIRGELVIAEKTWVWWVPA